ncbi:MAG: DUF3887 domain-containing protein [Candidatus Dormiibacterota bacterium]
MRGQHRLALVGLTLSIAACSSSSQSTTSTTPTAVPATPTPAAATTPVPPTALDTKAATVVTQLNSKDFAAIRAHFDPTMMATLSEAELATSWRTFQEDFGQFKSAEAPTHTNRGELIVEQVTVHMANRDGEVRVTYHPDQTIAGLFFLRPGVPLVPVP